MDLAGYIDVTEIDPRLLIQVAYSGSQPQGLGFLHAKPGGLDEATLNRIMEHAEKYPGRGIDLDYVHGRAMKFHIRNYEGRRYIDLDWYDHSREATKHLVRECGLPDVEARIAKAVVEKDEKDRAYAARCDKAARALVALAAEHGGKLSHGKEPIKDIYLRPEGDPVTEAWYFGINPAIKAGWFVEESHSFTLTPAGKALLQESSVAA